MTWKFWLGAALSVLFMLGLPLLAGLDMAGVL